MYVMVTADHPDGKMISQGYHIDKGVDVTQLFYMCLQNANPEDYHVRVRSVPDNPMIPTEKMPWIGVGSRYIVQDADHVVFVNLSRIAKSETASLTIDNKSSPSVRDFCQQLIHSR